MSRKTITIEIDDQGNSSIDLEGFEGVGCAEVVKSFHGGDEVTRSIKKREFHTRAADQMRASQSSKAMGA